MIHMKNLTLMPWRRGFCDGCSPGERVDSAKGEGVEIVRIHQSWAHRGVLAYPWVGIYERVRPDALQLCASCLLQVRDQLVEAVAGAAERDARRTA